MKTEEEIKIMMQKLEDKMTPLALSGEIDNEEWNLLEHQYKLLQWVLGIDKYEDIFY
jgi:hypothetical protein